MTYSSVTGSAFVFSSSVPSSGLSGPVSAASSPASSSSFNSLSSSSTRLFLSSSVRFSSATRLLVLQVIARFSSQLQEIYTLKERYQILKYLLS